MVVALNNEAELLSRAQAGDDRAFADLVGAHRAAIRAACAWITGSIGDAQEALQDTLVAAWPGIDQFRAEARFSMWLFRIASTAALAVVRHGRDVADVEIETASARRDLGEQVADADRLQCAPTDLLTRTPYWPSPPTNDPSASVPAAVTRNVQ
jgi:DNA-directed RNA polymerase specialized sigma24 family protein